MKSKIGSLKSLKLINFYSDYQEKGKITQITIIKKRRETESVQVLEILK